MAMEVSVNPKDGTRIGEVDYNASLVLVIS
jgi:hypothetical protein